MNQIIGDDTIDANIIVFIRKGHKSEG